MGNNISSKAGKENENLPKGKETAKKWKERFDNELNMEKLVLNSAYYFQEWRERQDMSQFDIAGVLGMSKGAVWKWEQGESRIPIDKVMALSELSGDSLDSILFGRVPMVEKKIQERLRDCSYEEKEYIWIIIDTMLESWGKKAIPRSGQNS